VLPTAASAAEPAVDPSVATPAPFPTSDKAAEDNALTKPNEHRAGVVIGLSAGLGIGGASGYPNKAAQIGDPAYYASSGLGAGGVGSLAVLGALTDYLNFGFFFGGGSSANSSWKTSTFAGGFRVETFPLYTLVPRFRDLGLTAQFGLGATKIDARRGAYPGAEGVQSFLGIGAFYEWRITNLFGGHLAGGPQVNYSATITRPVDRHDLSVGGRIVLYTAL
jgi:hypothetical protein